MPDLSLSTDDLIAAGASLRSVAEEFYSADTNTERFAAAAGDERLARVIRRFSTSWDKKREGMVESISVLSDACGAIGGRFEEVDREFGAALRGEK